MPQTLPAEPTPARALDPAPNPLRRLARQPEVRGLALGAAVLGLLQMAALAGAWLLLARLLGGLLFAAGGRPGVLSPAGWSWPTVLALGGLLALRALLAAAAERFTAGRAAAARWRLHREVLSRLDLAGPLALHGARPSEQLLTLQQGLGKVEPFYARFLPQAALCAVACPLIFLAVLRLDPLSAAVLAFSGPLLLVFMWLVGLASRRAADGQWAALTRLGGGFADALANLNTLRVHGGVEAHRRHLAQSGEGYRAGTMKVLQVAMLNGFVLEFAATISTALVAVEVGVRLFGGHLGFVPALAALLLTPEFFAPLRQLGADHHAAMEAGTAAVPLLRLLDTPLPQVGERPPPGGAPALELRGVSVRLGEKTVLDDLHLTLPAGRTLVLTGQSGAGKSTLLNLLCGYLPYGGSVRLGAEALSALDVRAWRARVGLVSQHPYLLAASLAENLRLAAPDAGDEQLSRAARLAGLDPLLARLPAGLQTPVGEGGWALSGGERARVSVARALLRPTPLVLLDEPTAGLDAAGAVSLLSALAALRGRTLVLVTHRPEDARAAGLGAAPGDLWRRLEGGQLHPLDEPLSARQEGAA